jgi:hypothetical protein
MSWLALQVIPSFHCTETEELVVRVGFGDESPASMPIAS